MPSILLTIARKVFLKRFFEIRIDLTEETPQHLTILAYIVFYKDKDPRESLM